MIYPLLPRLIHRIKGSGRTFGGSHLGKVRTKQLPFPNSDFTLILPSCKAMICLHRLNPIPEPDVLVVKKGTKILSKTVGRIPSPLSDIANVGLPLEKNFICISLSAFRSHVSRAFFNKLISTCRCR